jgi:spore coat protein U-like protein
MRHALILRVLFVCICGVLAVLALRQPAPAATTTCTVSAASISFTAFDVYGAAVSGTGTVSGSCSHASGTVTITITADNGKHATGSNRGMTCAACTAYPNDVLQYQLYTDAAHTTPWTGATGITATCTGCSGNTATTWTGGTFYGQIPAAVAGGINDVAVSGANTYSDTVTITINY